MARNETQNQEMRDARREQILAVAVRLFATRGLASTKISDIAKAASMSQGLMYHYFHSKEEIFTEIIRTAFEKMNTAANGLEASDMPPDEKIKTAVTMLLNSVVSSNDFAWYSALISAASICDAVPEKAMTIIKKERDIPYDVIARIVEQGQKNSTIRSGDAKELAVLFWTAIKGLAMHKLALGKRFSPPSPDLLMRIFFD